MFAQPSRQTLKISYARYHFPSSVTQNAVWIYPQFNLIPQYVEDLLAERGFDVSRKTVRLWGVKIRAV